MAFIVDLVLQKHSAYEELMCEEAQLKNMLVELEVRAHEHSGWRMSVWACVSHPPRLPPCPWPLRIWCPSERPHVRN
eukprot:2654897-Prymnesium_polylepis.2